MRQRSREELEQLVEERTRDLRTAQEGLVQSAKLAALGQMSAALAHEINQPLTAQRSASWQRCDCCSSTAGSTTPTRP